MATSSRGGRFGKEGYSKNFDNAVVNFDAAIDQEAYKYALKEIGYDGHD